MKLNHIVIILFVTLVALYIIVCCFIFASQSLLPTSQPTIPITNHAPYGIEVTYKTLKIDGRWGDVAVLDKLGFEFFNTSQLMNSHAFGCQRYHIPIIYNLPENCPAPYWVIDLDTGKQYRVYDLPVTTKWMYCDSHGDCTLN